MRFWLRRGVDGFRVDVLYHVMKDEAFRDNPLNPGYREGIDSKANRFLPVHTADLPETMGIVAAMRSVVDEFPERVLIGELYLPWNASSRTTASASMARTCLSISC